MLKVDELACAGITPSFTLPDPGLYQKVAAIAVTSNTTLAPAKTTFIGTFNQIFSTARYSIRSDIDRYRSLSEPATSAVQKFVVNGTTFTQTRLFAVSRQ